MFSIQAHIFFNPPFFFFNQLWTSDNAADEGEGGDGGEN